MATLHVQFGDKTEAVIVSYFSAPQDPGYFAHLGDVEDTDPRWAQFYEAQNPVLRNALPAPSAGG